jgi:beta-lactamase superfamily II metal-dependent hydrolase
MTRYSLALLVGVFSHLAFGQANGKLQIHFMDVGQGDGAVLISPQGQIVLFDGGNAKDCPKPLAYLAQLEISSIDYMVLSHYHADHFGCETEILTQSPLKNFAYDRGGSYNSKNYDDYVQALGSKRKQANAASPIVLDPNSGHPVTISFVAMNGNGITTTNENDLSLVAVVQFDALRIEIGGDLSGFDTNSYKDIETSVAPKVGEIDVYKVHHHCSAYSTNESWLSITKPTIAIVSAGLLNNDYGHPTQECLERLHNAGIKTYWTELGKGATPEPNLDIVAGNIVVESDPTSPSMYSVRYESGTVTYPVKGTPAPVPTSPTGSSSPSAPSATPPSTSVPKYAWSKNSTIYHLASCRLVKTINPENLQRSDIAPSNKTLHADCPKP